MASEYPKWLYHADKPKVEVKDFHAEEAAKAGGYQDNPIQPADMKAQQGQKKSAA